MLRHIAGFNTQGDGSAAGRALAYSEGLTKAVGGMEADLNEPKLRKALRYSSCKEVLGVVVFRASSTPNCTRNL
jgi:hypothetical protein